MELLIKFYTINYFHYHHLVPLTKRAISSYSAISTSKIAYMCLQSSQVHNYLDFLGFFKCIISLEITQLIVSPYNL